MATRLYFGKSAPPVSPAFTTGWDVTSGAVRRVLEPAKGNAGAAFEALSVSSGGNTPAGASDVLLVQYVSAQLASNVTISAAIAGQMSAFEGIATADMDTQCVVWVMKTDGTARGTLITFDATALGHEWNPSSLRNISIPKGGSVTPTSVAALATDRVVLELGYRKHENAATNRSGSIQGGNPSGTDLPVDETDTSAVKVPWIEFTDNLTFSGSTVRVTQVAPEVLSQGTSAVRVTQVAPEVLSQGTSAVRVTQVAIEILRSRIDVLAFTADAILRTTASSSFTADSVIVRTASSSFTADAVVFRTISGSATADAVLFKAQAGSFTADAAIVRTGAATFTADAVIFATIAGSFTANAVLFKSQAGSLTADAIIARTTTVTLTADAVVKATISGSFTIDAVLFILGEGAGSFTADAVLFKTQSSSFTADAFITANRTGSFTADAIVKKTLSASYTADAVVAGTATTHSGSFTANAFLAQLVEYDDFNRTVAEGFGLRYRNFYTFGVATEDRGEVNGSEGVALAVVPFGFTGYESATGYHRPRTGYMQFDFWVGADTTDNSFFYAVDSSNPNPGGYEPTEIELYHSGTGGTWAADMWPTDLYYEFDPDASSWYTIKGYFEGFNGGLVAFKIWKRSDPEPDVWSATGSHDALGGFGTAFWQSRFFVDPFFDTAEDAKVDNLKAWRTSGPWEFADYMTADAVIYGGPSFVADAIIRRTFGDGSTTAPTYGADSSGTGSGGPAVAAGIPSGTSDGDLMVAWISYDSVGDSAREWSRDGWFTVANALTPSGDHGLAVLWKVKDASDSGTQLFAGTGTGSVSARATISQILNADPIQPFALVGYNTDDGGATSHPTGSITSPILNALLLVGAAGSLASTWTPASGMTEQDDGSTGSWVTLTIDSMAVTDTAIGVKTLVSAVPVASGLVWLVIRPPGRNFTVDAEIAAFSVTFTAKAVLSKTSGGSLMTINAFIVGPVNRSFTANAELIVPGGRGSLTANAVLYAGTTASFTAAAWIYVPRTDPEGPGVPPGPGNPGDPGYGAGETPLVSIMVDGVDITRFVVIHEANFTMLVNGAVGTCNVKVRDDDHILNFTGGQEITVDIDGKRRFGGYILQPTRLFAFPAQDASDPTSVSRFHRLTGVDYNILLTKRIVRDKTDPNHVELRHWPAGTHDDVAIKYIFDHYTDLAADGVTYEGVTHVGSPNPDKPGVIGSGGLKFVDLLRELNRLVSAVFYIDAYKVLNYVDVDIPDAIYGLSDNPGDGEVGYRDFSKVDNGANLVNDAMVWGAGQGSRRIKFKRVTSESSIAAHGLWQYGEFTTQMFRQASVDMRADTIVNGTAQSRRGGKNDQVSWAATTFNTSFEVGQRVPIESEVFGVSDVVPIRRLSLSFPTKRPQFDLLLSHEIDEPWNIFEFWFPHISFDYYVPKVKVITHLPNESGCGDSTCFSDFLIDDFNGRSVGSGWGTASSGYVWNDSSGSSDVTGNVGRLLLSGGATETLSIGGPTAPWLSQFYSCSFQFTISNVPTGSNTTDLQMTDVLLQMAFADGPPITGSAKSYISAGSGDVTFIPHTFWQTGITYTLRKVVTGDTITATVSKSGGSYEASGTISFARSNTFSLGGELHGAGSQTITVDDFGASVDLCSNVQFDDFEGRTVTNEWGISTTGIVWQIQGPGSYSKIAAEFGYGKFEQRTTDVTGGQKQVTTQSHPEMWSGDCDMTTRFLLVSRSAGTASQMNFIFRGQGFFDWGWDIRYSDVDVITLELAGNTGVNSVVLSGVAPNGTYNVRYQRTGISHRVKFWEQTTAEPVGWTIEQSGLDLSEARSQFDVLHARETGSGHDFAVWYHFIDFDYEGRPCYQDCSGVGQTIMDTFTRGVTGGWGTASSGGAWSTSRPLGSSTVGVDGDRGTIANPGSNGSVTVMTASMPDVFDGSGSAFAEFRTIVDTTVRNVGGGFYNASQTTGIFWQISPLNNKLQWGRFQSGGINFMEGPTPPADGTVFWVGLRLEAGVVYCKYWLDGDDEPSSWSSLTPQTGSVMTVDAFSIARIHSSQSSPSGTLGIDAILFNLDGVCAGVHAIDEGIASSGSGRSDQSAVGAVTIFIVQPYEPNTVRAFIDGKFQRPGIEFIELDNEAGLVRFTTAPTFGQQVTFFYEVLPV